MWIFKFIFLIHHLIIVLETLLFIFHFKFKNLNFKYNWLLNDMRIRGVDALLSQKSLFNFWLPPKFNCSYPSGLVPDFQICHIKWHRTMHTVDSLYSRIPNAGSILICGWLNLWMWNPIYRGPTDFVFIENNLHVSGPAHFKAMLFKSQWSKISIDDY